MKLSIITICYNDKAGFEKTAESVTTQTCKDFEWIVIDGASSDGSVDMQKQYQSHMACYVSESDNGIYNAMNKGIAQAHGQYCLFLNSGDYFYSENVVKSIIPLLNDKDIYIGDIYESDKIDIPQFKSSDFTIEGILNRLTSLSYPHQGSFMSTSLLKEFGGYREDLRIVSDWYFFYNTIIYHGASIEFIPIVISIFDKTGVSSNAGLKLKEERDRSLQDNPYLFLLYDFYSQNHRMISTIKASKLGFLLYRIAYYVSRHLVTKTR